MKIREIYVKSFGCLSDFKKEFHDGFNAVTENNGFGKTTLATFVKAMFYSLGYSRSSALEENELKRFRPWNSTEKFGGSVTFEHDGKLYRIERTFGATQKDETAFLVDFEKNKIEEMINKIITVEIEDDVTFEIDKNMPIKEDNEYGGYRFKLIAKLRNLRIPFGVDISTGDLITPRAIEYNYKTILENDNINLYTYNYETIIAEKLETILKRNTANSRMKDYYDLYYFATYKWKDIDINTLKSAIHTTFNHRNSEEYLKRFNTIIKNILEDETLTARWNKYRKEHEYAKEIEFNDTIRTIKKIYDVL